MKELWKLDNAASTSPDNMKEEVNGHLKESAARFHAMFHLGEHPNGRVPE